MAKYEDHRILQHLDNPKRILYWTFDEAVLMVAPFFLGMIFQHAIFGVIASIAGTFLLRKVKQKMGFENLRRVMYWYLPLKAKNLHGVPPSHIREYVG